MYRAHSAAAAAARHWESPQVLESRSQGWFHLVFQFCIFIDKYICVITTKEGTERGREEEDEEGGKSRGRLTR